MKLVSKGNIRRSRINSAGRNPGAVRSNSVPGKTARRPQATDNPVLSGKGIPVNDKKNISKAPEKKKSHVKTVAIIVLIFVFCISALFISLGFYVDSLDTVFPNVWADGINVSGLTLEETEQLLIERGYEQNAEGIAATVVFPDNSSFTVTGGDVGLSLNAAEAARTIYAFGRQDTFFNNEIVYIRSIFNRTDLSDLSTANFDDSIVRELSTEYSLQFNRTLLNNNMERTDEGITISLGTEFNAADDNDVFNLAINTLRRAVEEHEDLTVNYVPEPTSDESIDLQLLFDTIHIDPIASVWDVETLSATASSEGRTFDLSEAEAQLRNATSGQTIFIPIVKLYPDHTQEEIEAMIYRDVLAEGTSRMTNVANRMRNIELASGFINGTILNPGQVFSFNEVVGRRTKERGFLEANGIIGGRLEPVTGGGICQVTSTLYSAVLRTQLEVTERRAHGLTVSYLPYGEDATVAYGNLDFKFKNSTDFPIRIEIEVDLRTRDINVKLIGTNRDGSYVEIEHGEPRITPFVIEDRDSEDLYTGDTEVWTPGQNGVRVVTNRRHFNAEGELINEQSITSTYNVQNRIILHGTKERPPPPPPPPPPPGPGPGDGFPGDNTGDNPGDNAGGDPNTGEPEG